MIRGRVCPFSTLGQSRCGFLFHRHQNRILSPGQSKAAQQEISCACQPFLSYGSTGQLARDLHSPDRR